ncbi:MAG: hypothetical protein WCK79_08025 [Actinomycetes bacterium]
MANAIFYQNNVGFKIYSGSAYVDLTDHVMAATINRSFDELDVTAMGQLGHSFIAGLESSTISIDFLNDDSTGQVMQILNGLVGTNAAFKMLQTVTAIGALTSTGTVSATNQLYTGNILVNKITPIAGKVGDVAVQSLTFTVSGSITVASSGTW